MTEVNVKILTFGAATQDVFLTGKALHARRDVRTRDYVEQFPLGAKLALDNVYFDTGGGATNAAVTFARQGLEAGYIGKIGHDPAGGEVIRALRREGVATDRVVYDPRVGTSYSALLVANTGERTILNYRGASHNLAARDIAIRTLEADWFYVTSLAGNLDLLGKLLKHANNRGIRVAIDPGTASSLRLRNCAPCCHSSPFSRPTPKSSVPCLAATTSKTPFCAPPIFAPTWLAPTARPAPTPPRPASSTKLGSTRR